MPARHAILGLLVERQRHGYEIRGALAEEYGDEWAVEFGQLYRLLDDLRRRGWITTRETPGVGGPRRKVHRISRIGRRELDRWLADPEAPVEYHRDAFLVKLRVGVALGLAHVPALVESRRKLLTSQRDAVRQIWQHARHEGNGGRWLVADARLRQLEAALATLPICCAAVADLHADDPAPSDLDPIMAIGSDDLLLDMLCRAVTDALPTCPLQVQPVGSLGGLIALREGRAHLAGTHLLDDETGEYNVPFVKHLLFEEPVVLVNLAHREQGLMVQAANPQNIQALGDLARENVRIVNRQHGAGTRVLLKHLLRKAEIDPSTIQGYNDVAPTHNAVAASVSTGAVDAGPGIRAVAQEWRLEFISLGQERFDLAIPRSQYDSRRLRPLLDQLCSAEFKRQAATLTGYDVSQMGEVVAQIC